MGLGRETDRRAGRQTDRQTEKEITRERIHRQTVKQYDSLHREAEKQVVEGN